MHAQVLAGTAETGLDFVDDEQQAVLVANAAQALEVALRRRDVAALAEYGLDEDRRSVPRCGLLLQQKLKLGGRENDQS